LALLAGGRRDGWRRGCRRLVAGGLVRSRRGASCRTIASSWAVSAFDAAADARGPGIEEPLPIFERLMGPPAPSRRLRRPSPSTSLPSSHQLKPLESVAYSTSRQASRAPRSILPPARPRPITLGADKAYEAEDFVGELRSMNATPHVAQNTNGRVCDRRPHDAPCRLRSGPTHPQADRGSLRLGQPARSDPSSAPTSASDGPSPSLRRLQSAAEASGGG
jgi:hypothetical protein